METRPWLLIANFKNKTTLFKNKTTKMKYILLVPPTTVRKFFKTPLENEAFKGKVQCPC